MGRKKVDPAVLRTVDMFTGKTTLEAAEHMALEDEDRTERIGDPLALVERAEHAAVRWLGLDVFHEGDDVKVAVHKNGHAVMVLVSTSGAQGKPYGTTTLKLSRHQWSKLRRLARE